MYFMPQLITVDQLIIPLSVFKPLREQSDYFNNKFNFLSWLTVLRLLASIKAKEMLFKLSIYYSWYSSITYLLQMLSALTC